MAQQTSPKSVVEWYSVSVSTFRGVTALFILVSALIGGFLLFQHWEHRALRQQAAATIEEAAELVRRAEIRDDFDEIRLGHLGAWENLETARSELAAERYQSALERAENSVDQLEIALGIDQDTGRGKNRLVSVQGAVEYRRGERGTWKRARPNDLLEDGDWVKTSADGTAEIRLPDDSKYTLRRNTMVRLGSTRNLLTGTSEPVTDLDFGWIDIDTNRQSINVKTPKIEAKIDRGSNTQVEFDAENDVGRVTSFAGATEIKTAAGETRQLGPLEQVEQVGDALTAAKSIPKQPRLLRPAVDHQANLGDRALELAWREVPGARRYALQVARNPLFEPNVVTDDNRRKTSARLGLRGEGVFYWQVAAIDGSGARGPWSEARTFRVAARRGDSADDKTPPELEIHDVQTSGSLVIVSGRTEAGAAVRINDEAASVEIDGSFRMTVQMSQVGFAFIRIVATDAWENSTVIKRRVFIDAL